MVRHGEASAHWGQSADPGLSALGVVQAECCASDLLDRIDSETAVVSSPLARAVQTAEPLVRVHGGEIAISSAFREIPAPVPLAQRRDWLRGFMQGTWSNQPDSLLEWRDTLLSSLYARSSTTVVFTHFLVINTVIGLIRGTDATLSFWPDNASVTELRLREGRLELVALGREMKTVVN